MCFAGIGLCAHNVFITIFGSSTYAFVTLFKEGSALCILIAKLHLILTMKTKMTIFVV